MNTTRINVQKSNKSAVLDVDIKKGTSKLAHATYKTKDRDGDLGNKGMFTKSWKEFKDTRFFLNHNKEQTPGTIDGFEEDDNHAYTIVKAGDWTLGQDVIKMMHAGAATDVSYTGIATKWSPLSGGGKSFHEMLHEETSILTHWGAHPDSKVKVMKQLGEKVIKSLSDRELTFLRNLVNVNTEMISNMSEFAKTLNEESELYVWINEIMSSESSNLGWLKRQLVYGKRADAQQLFDLEDQVTKMLKFCETTDASDECIQTVQKQAKQLQDTIKNLQQQTTSAADTALKQAEKGDNSLLKELHLLNAKMSFT